MFAALHAVLHDEEAGYWVGTRDRAIDCERSSRNNFGRERRRARHDFPHRLAAQVKRAGKNRGCREENRRRRTFPGRSRRERRMSGAFREISMTQKANLLLVDDDANTLASLSR